MNEVFLKMNNVVSIEEHPGRLNGLFMEVYGGECLALAGRTYSGIRELCSILARKSDYHGLITLKDGRQLNSCRSPYQASMACIDQKMLKASGRMRMSDWLVTMTGQGRMFSIIDTDSAVERYQKLLDELEIKEDQPDLNTLICDLSQRQRLQFAVLSFLCAGSRCLLLDRVFQGQHDEEIGETAELLTKVKQRGIAIILVIDEYFDQIEYLADRLMTLRHGRVTYVFYPQASGHRFDRQQLEWAISGQRETTYGQTVTEQADQNLHLVVNHREKNYSLFSGQRIGIYDPQLSIPSDYPGLAGYLKTTGWVRLNDQELNLEDVDDFIKHRIVIISSDYERELFFNLSPVSNVAMLSGKRHSRILVSDRIDRYIYWEVCGRYEYLNNCFSLIDRQHCYGISELQARQLTVAKWLSLDPDIVVFFDLGDTYQPAEQHQSAQLFHQLAQQGKLVIAVSANLQFLERTSEIIISKKEDIT